MNNIVLISNTLKDGGYRLKNKYFMAISNDMHFFSPKILPILAIWVQKTAFYTIVSGFFLNGQTSNHV